MIRGASQLFAVLLYSLAGCAGSGPGADGLSARGSGGDVADSFSGLYRGGFAAALTEDPTDDVNYVSCEPTRERCLGGDEPLVDVLLELRRDASDRLQLGFYRSLADRERGVELDLLGRGCGTQLAPGDVTGPKRAAGPARVSFPLTARNRLCLNKLRPTGTHELRVEVGRETEDGAPILQVLIDKDVRSANFLYVVEDGKQRRVRMDLANTVESRGRGRYRVCIEDDLGEYDRCVLTDRELKHFVLPVPVPGGVALSYTWWEKLVPDLKRTRGLYEVEQYRGRFTRVPESAARASTPP